MASFEMTEARRVDSALEEALARRARDGVVDIKCHIGISDGTRPQEIKIALLNALNQDDAGMGVEIPLSSVSSFDDLRRQLGLAKGSSPTLG